MCICVCIPLASFNPDLQEEKNKIDLLVLFTVCVYVGGNMDMALCAALVDSYVCHF